jgi:hypothetical protein
MVQHATCLSLAEEQIRHTMRIVDMVDTERMQVKKAADMDFVQFRRAYAVEGELMRDVGYTRRPPGVLGIVPSVEVIDAERSEIALSFGTFA